MLALLFSLWLDVRGRSCGADLDALLNLYSGVRTRMDAAGLPPPAGSAVAGVLHLEADLDDEDGEDGGLSLLALHKDGSVWLDGDRVGSTATTEAAVEDALRPNGWSDHLALLGKREADVLPLLDSALRCAAATMEGGDEPPYLLAEVQSAAGLEALQRVQRTLDGPSAPAIGAILKPDEALWFEALKLGGGTAAPQRRRSTDASARPSRSASGAGDAGGRRRRQAKPQGPARRAESAGAAAGDAEAAADHEDGSATPQHAHASAGDGQEREQPSRRARRRARGGKKK